MCSQLHLRVIPFLLLASRSSSPEQTTQARNEFHAIGYYCLYVSRLSAMSKSRRPGSFGPGPFCLAFAVNTIVERGSFHDGWLRPWTRTHTRTEVQSWPAACVYIHEDHISDLNLIHVSLRVVSRSFSVWLSLGSFLSIHQNKGSKLPVLLQLDSTSSYYSKEQSI